MAPSTALKAQPSREELAAIAEARLSQTKAADQDDSVKHGLALASKRVEFERMVERGLIGPNGYADVSGLVLAPVVLPCPRSEAMNSDAASSFCESGRESHQRTLLKLSPEASGSNADRGSPADPHPHRIRHHRRPDSDSQAYDQGIK